MAQKINLPLAQKMVEKMEKEGKMEQEQETILYLMILELRSDWEVRERPYPYLHSENNIYCREG